MAFGGSKVVEYIIRAKDATAQAVSSASGRLSSLGSRVKASFANLGKSIMANAANIKAGFDMVVGAAQRMASIVAGAVKAAFRFEKAVSDFKVLTGSIDTAKAHIADLKAFAASTPLTFDDLAKASKLLLSFGASVESVMPNLKMLGDISMGDAQKFQGLALVFAQVQSAGKLMGQDLLQMINQGFNPLTVIAQQTGQSVAELKDIMSEGGISFEMVAEAMRVATSEGGLFFNAMEEGAKTGEGLVSTLKDNWSESVRQFGSAFMEAAKGGLQFLIDKLQTLNKDGTIEMWAEKALEALGKVKEVLQGVGGAINWVWEKAGVGDAYHHVAGAVAGVSAAAGSLFGGGSFGDAAREMNKAAIAEISKGHYAEKAARRGWLGTAGTEAVAERDAKAEGYDARKAAIAKRKAEQAAKEAAEAQAKADEAATEERKCIADMMAEYKAKAEEAAAKKAAEKAAEAERREQEKLAREQERLLEQLERERERLAEKAYQKEVKLAQDAVAESSRAESNARSRLEAANQKVAQAWTWYRDKDAMQAWIDDKVAQREAEKRFDKDFERLRNKWRTHGGWRDAEVGKLSAEEEAVRQVALAKEEQAAAQKALDAIEENTRDLAEKLDELLTAKEE